MRQTGKNLKRTAEEKISEVMRSKGYISTYISKGIYIEMSAIVEEQPQWCTQKGYEKVLEQRRQQKATVEETN